MISFAAAGAIVVLCVAIGLGLEILWTAARVWVAAEVWQ